MRVIGSQTYQFSEHLRQVEALLDPIRSDRSIDDAERRHLISEVLAAANARALSLNASGDDQGAPVASLVDVRRLPRRQRGLARTG